MSKKLTKRVQEQIHRDEALYLGGQLDDIAAAIGLPTDRFLTQDESDRLWAEVDRLRSSRENRQSQTSPLPHRPSVALPR